MKVLALDTSSLAASCALLEGDKLLGEFFLNTGMTHSETAMVMVDHLLKTAKVSPGELSILAVSVGPGSFTGLRIGVSAIKGMAYALNLPCAAVSTLEGLAGNLTCFSGLIIPVMDARRNQVYTSRFRGDGKALLREAPDQAVPLEQVGRWADAETGPVWLTGDGAAMAKQKLQRDNLVPAPPALLHQRASSVGYAALELHEKGKLLDAGQLIPQYLRLSQAERELLEKNGET